MPIRVFASTTEEIKNRTLREANYFIELNSTVRDVAKMVGVSKSTVHKDMTERLDALDQELAKKVKKIIEINKAERHIRGGEATRKKYQKK